MRGSLLLHLHDRFPTTYKLRRGIVGSRFFYINLTAFFVSILTRIKDGFVLCDVCGETVIVGEGLGAVDFGKLLVLNDTAT